MAGQPAPEVAEAEEPQAVVEQMHGMVHHHERQNSKGDEVLHESPEIAELAA
jgi:hypothetical protein